MTEMELFKADFVEAVNGVLEKHFKGLEGKPNKVEIDLILYNLFGILITIFSIADKIKGGGK